MTIEIKIPAGQLALQYHIGQALRNAAIESGYDALQSSINRADSVIVTVDNPLNVEQLRDAVVEMKKSGCNIPLQSGEQHRVVNTESSTVVSITDQVDDTDVTEGEPITPDTPDADGIVWDKRIHSDGKTRNADNTWRVARKPKDKTKEEWDKYVEDVKAELLAVAAAENSVTLVPESVFGIVDGSTPVHLTDEQKQNLSELMKLAPAADPVPPAPAADPVPPAPAADPVPPAPAADPVPPAPAADPVPPVTETVADPVPPAPAADPVPPAPAADPVPPAQVDEQLTFGKMIASITPLKAKIPADVDFNQFIADIAASMGIPVMNPKAPLAAFATAGPKVLSQVKQAVEGLTHG